MKYLICTVLFGLLSMLAATAHQEPGQQLWWIFLETGDRKATAEDKVQEMQMKHIENFQLLHGEKKLFAAGPMQDPSTKKRGIVLVTAKSRDELPSLFTRDPYVTGGFMKLNASPCTAMLALRSTDLDPEGIEEVACILIKRADKLNALTGTDRWIKERATVRSIMGVAKPAQIGGWYVLHEGDVWQILYSRELDHAKLKAQFDELPEVKEGFATVEIWKQWFGKQVVSVD